LQLIRANSGVAARMALCAYADCVRLIVRSAGQGRPRMYCAQHAAQRKREQDRARVPACGPAGIPECCADHGAAFPGRRVCPQHQQWRRFTRYEAHWMKAALDDPQVLDLLTGGQWDGFSVTAAHG